MHPSDIAAFALSRTPIRGGHRRGYALASGRVLVFSGYRVDADMALADAALRAFEPGAKARKIADERNCWPRAQRIAVAADERHVLGKQKLLSF